MPNTVNSSNEFGGWNSPISDGAFPLPLKISGFAIDPDPRAIIVIQLYRNEDTETPYLDFREDFTSSDGNRKNFDFSVNSIKTGPNSILGRVLFVTWDDLPRINFYVLTPAEEKA
ncbi:hypothetical protein [Pseudomonas rustica]|uniref:hypothetical protein n=1 Tax=Pseudomonas rustica TaxID=2827099 RepID=UPI001BAF4A27|nr:hypothetical protein [Pseudomonas rustica]MBS4087549.1 hypothetical protein [Pseudomonas rustica]